MKKAFFLLGICFLSFQAISQKLFTQMMYGQIILQTMESGEIYLDGRSLGLVKEGTRSTISEVIVGKHVLEFVFSNKFTACYVIFLGDKHI